MPMNFPDMDSLKRHAEVIHFRAPQPNESEEDYREALATYNEKTDSIEAHEVRFKVGWDKWTPEQKEKLLKRRMGL